MPWAPWDGTLGDVAHTADAVEAGLFLVELHAAGAAPRDIERMHRALYLAATRLGATGAQIRWVTGMTLPDEGRVLCVVAAADRAQVARVRDTAGLLGAAIHAVLPVSEAPPRRGLATSATYETVTRVRRRDI
jgi:hypothetical protein